MKDKLTVKEARSFFEHPEVQKSTQGLLDFK